MDVSIERPPNYDAIVARFGRLPETTVFAYGDTIHMPGHQHVEQARKSLSLQPDLVVHEMVHRRQQEQVGGPEAWWDRYLADDQFRLDQEVEAYRAQIAFHTDRARRRECKRRVAKDLSSAMYGRLVSKDEALRLLSMSHVVAA